MLVVIVGLARSDVAAVGDERDVGAKQVRVSLDELGQVLGGALLLALHHDLDRDRWLAGGKQRPDRGGVDRDPALVVGGPASVHPTVADLRQERRRLPELRVGDRLDVVMCVEEDRRRSGGARRLPEHRGMAAVELEQPDVVQPGGGRMSAVASALARTLAGS